MRRNIPEREWITCQRMLNILFFFFFCSGRNRFWEENDKSTNEWSEHVFIPCLLVGGKKILTAEDLSDVTQLIFTVWKSVLTETFIDGFDGSWDKMMRLGLEKFLTGKFYFSARGLKSMIFLAGHDRLKNVNLGSDSDSKSILKNGRLLH